MAAELARYGLSVRIVEKAAHRTDKSKALVIWSRTLELMDRMGCTSSFVKAGFKATAASITAGDKQISPHITLGGVGTSLSLCPDDSAVGYRALDGAAPEFARCKIGAQS